METIKRKDITGIRKELENSMKELRETLLDMSPEDASRFEANTNFYKMAEVIQSMKDDHANILVPLDEIKVGLESTLLEATLLFVNCLIKVTKNHMDVVYYIDAESIGTAAVQMLNNGTKADDDAMQTLYDFAIAHMMIEMTLNSGNRVHHSKDNGIKEVTNHDIDTEAEKTKLIDAMHSLEKSSLNVSLKAMLYLLGDSMRKFPNDKCVIEFDGNIICLYQIAFEVIDSEIELSKFGLFERETYFNMPNAAEFLKKKIEEDPSNKLASISYRNLCATTLMNKITESMGRMA